VKKREHGKRRHLPSLPQDLDPEAYLCFRLCHLCLFLNESSSEIVDCQRCRRTLTVEPYLREHAHEFKDMESVNLDADDVALSPALAGLKWHRGLTGLSVLW
jgi:hypothetical protein